MNLNPELLGQLLVIYASITRKTNTSYLLEILLNILFTNLISYMSIRLILQRCEVYKHFAHVL